MVLFLILPMIVGGIWTGFIKTTSRCKLLIQTWVYGTITMFAITQLVVVPMIANRMRFTSFVLVWCVVTGFICVGSLVLNGKTMLHLFRKLLQMMSGKNRTSAAAIWQTIRHRSYVLALGMAALLLIGGQAVTASKYQHLDDDDSRFIALELLAVEQDTMLTQSPIDSTEVTWKLGEVRKDLTSPWTMHVALLSKLSQIHPATMSHLIMPFVFILMSYGACALAGMHLFRREKGFDAEKLAVFLILLSVVNLFGYTSTHTLSSVTALRIWQGKAMFAAVLIPLMMSVLLELQENNREKIWYALLFVCCMAASLTSGVGIILGAMLVGIYGVVGFLNHRRMISMAATWCCALPCAVYALIYYFWTSIFQLY